MILTRDSIAGGTRCGAAAAELAILSVIACFVLAITVDFARSIALALFLTHCAESGALYGCQNPAQSIDTKTIKQVALKDTTGMSPAPTASATTGVDANGNTYVEVTVSCDFTAVTAFFGAGPAISLSRTVRMQVAQTAPS